VIELDGQDLPPAANRAAHAKSAEAVRGPHSGIVLDEHYEAAGEIGSCRLASSAAKASGSKRFGSHIAPAAAPHEIKVKNPPQPQSRARLKWIGVAANHQGWTKRALGGLPKADESTRSSFR
jgi:hypothetical protein